MKAILYLRVSTEDQVEGNSLDGQEEVCRRRAEGMGATVVAVLREEGVSGSLFLGRPEIQKALQMIESGQANVFITTKIDRGGRDVDGLRLIRKRILAAGAQMILCDGITVEDTPVSKLMYTQMGAFAEFERELIRERTMAGSRKLAEKGVMPQRAMHPYGYRITTRMEALTVPELAGQEGTYRIQEEEAVVVQRLFALYAAGWSLHRLCTMLTEEGVPSPRNGKSWARSTVKHLFENPVYKGEPTYGRHKGLTDENRLTQGMKSVKSIVAQKDVSRQIVLSAPALVAQELWDACNARLGENVHLLSGNPKRRYLLSGIIYCPTCRKRMTGETREQRGKVWRHYHCPDSRPSRNAARTVCTPTYFPAQVIEECVVTAALEPILRPEGTQAALEAIAIAERMEMVVVVDRQRWEAEEKELDAAEDALTAVMTERQRQGKSIAMFDRQFDALEARRQEWKAREPKAIPASEKINARFLSGQVLTTAEAVLRGQDTEAKREALAELVARVEPISPEEAEVWIRVPTIRDTVAIVHVFATVSTVRYAAMAAA